MFSGLTIWYWITNWCALLGGKIFLPNSTLIVYSSLYRIEASDLSPIYTYNIEALWSFPYPNYHDHIHLCSAHVQAVMLWDLLDVASDVTRKQSHSKLSDSLALTVFSPPLLQCSLNLVCRSVLEMLKPTGAGLRISAFWLVIVLCNGLWLLQRSFLDEGWGLYLWV